MITNRAARVASGLVGRRRSGGYGKPSTKSDWLDAVRAELDELEDAMNTGSGDLEMEFGDVLLNVLQLGRSMDLNATTAIERSAAKVNGRLDYLDEHEGEATVYELWRRAKELETK